MIQAWNFFLERRRARHIEMAERQTQSLVHVALAEPPQEATSIAGDEADLQSTEAAEPEKSTVPASAGTKPVFTLICCSCQQTIHLRRGQAPAVCMGLCQQPMHGNPGRCKESKNWVQVGDIGVCCSQACAVLYIAV
jgi:hypothetical protein